MRSGASRTPRRLSESPRTPCGPGERPRRRAGRRPARNPSDFRPPARPRGMRGRAVCRPTCSATEECSIAPPGLYLFGDGQPRVPSSLRSSATGKNPMPAMMPSSPPAKRAARMPERVDSVTLSARRVVRCPWDVRVRGRRRRRPSPRSESLFREQLPAQSTPVPRPFDCHTNS